MEAALRDRLEKHGVDTAMGIEAHMGNEAMYERILRLVLSDTSFEMLFKAAESEDAEVIFDISHSLKGTLGNLGLEELRLLVTDICESTRAGSIEGVKDKIYKVQEIYNRLVECM